MMINGKLLCIDLIEGNYLDNKEIIINYLKKLPELINMKIIRETELVWYDHDNKIESGFTGSVMISSSMISLHTYPLRSYMALDIFSCKDFSTFTIIEFTKKIFGGSLKWQEIKRGLQLFELVGFQEAIII